MHFWVALCSSSPRIWPFSYFGETMKMYFIISIEYVILNNDYITACKKEKKISGKLRLKVVITCKALRVKINKQGVITARLAERSLSCTVYCIYYRKFDALNKPANETLSFLAFKRGLQLLEYDVFSTLCLGFQCNMQQLLILSYTHNSTSTQKATRTLETHWRTNSGDFGDGVELRRSKMVGIWKGYHAPQLRLCSIIGPLNPRPPRLNAQRSVTHHRIPLCCCPLISNSTREMHAGCRQSWGHLHLVLLYQLCSPSVARQRIMGTPKWLVAVVLKATKGKMKNLLLQPSNVHCDKFYFDCARFL